MLFYSNHDIDLGTPDEVMTDEALEKSYGIPVAMLKHAETMTRRQIKEESEMIKSLQSKVSHEPQIKSKFSVRRFQER